MVIARPYTQEAIMPNAYHHVFFTVREGVSDQEVLDTIRRYRELAVRKGYIQQAHDVSLGTVVIPAGGDNEVARARQITGGFRWALTIRFDGREALDRYIRESPADIQAVNFLGLLTQPPTIMAHDHVDQSA
jgi:hypothetical protein